MNKQAQTRLQILGGRHEIFPFSNLVFVVRMKKHFSNIFNSVYVQGKQTQEIFKGSVGILREQCPITVPPDLRILPGTPWHDGLWLSCRLSQRFVCCFSTRLILSSRFPKGRSHG